MLRGGVGHESPDEPERHLRELYAEFNRRDVDAVLARMTADVDWPNAWRGGRLRGREAVRDYWIAQWEQIDPRVEPLEMSTRPDGRIEVRVRQTVRHLDGALASEGDVLHVYELSDGLVRRMEVEEPGHGE